MSALPNLIQRVSDSLKFPKATRSQPICRMTVSRHCLGLSPWLGIDSSLGACFFPMRSTSF